MTYMHTHIYHMMCVCVCVCMCVCACVCVCVYHMINIHKLYTYMYARHRKGAVQQAVPHGEKQLRSEVN